MTLGQLATLASAAMARTDRHMIAKPNVRGPGSDQVCNRELTIRAHFGQDLSGVVHVSHKSRR
jgi:hypothetical protein